MAGLCWPSDTEVRKLFIDLIHRIAVFYALKLFVNMIQYIHRSCNYLFIWKLRLEQNRLTFSYGSDPLALESTDYGRNAKFIGLFIFLLIGFWHFANFNACFRS